MENLEELLASRARSRLLDGTLGLSLGSEELLSSEGLGVRVESEEDSLVSERVLLLGEGPWIQSVRIGDKMHEKKRNALFWTAWPAGRTTDWISSELMRRVTSEVEILAVGRLLPLSVRISKYKQKHEPT